MGATSALLKAGKYAPPDDGKQRLVVRFLPRLLFQKSVFHHAQENSRRKEGYPWLDELVDVHECHPHFFIYKSGFQQLTDVPASNPVQWTVAHLASLCVGPLKI